MRTIPLLMIAAVTTLPFPLWADPASVPANGRIVLQEFGCRDWGPDLVHYRLDPKLFPTGKLALTDAAGRAVPFQIENNVLAFVATLPKGTTATYTLAQSDRDRSAENSPLRFAETADFYEVGNAQFTLRVPRGRAAEPLGQWRAAGGEWTGGSRLVTERKIVERTARVRRRGPACVTLEIRYRFEPAGTYACRVEVIADAPFARISEEFDFGDVAIAERPDWLLVELERGWQPASVRFPESSGEAGAPVVTPPVAWGDYLKQRREEAHTATGNVGGFGVPPQPTPPLAGLMLLEKIVPGGKWGGYRGGVLLTGAVGGVGMAMLHVGSWRRTMALNLWHSDATGAVVALPLGVRLSRWYLDVADDQSPFSTHEHDPDLPASYGRREWALYFGDAIETVQPCHGTIGLDRYKDWVVDHPESAAAKDSYPRAFFSRELAARLKESIDQHPSRAEVEKYYIVSGRTEDAVRHAQEVIAGLKSDPTGNWRVLGLTHYRQAQLLAFVNKADDALACRDLPAELRAELRRWLALWANLLSEPDINPRGAGVHLGNNNMTFNRSLALPYFAALLPDHPRYAEWMAQVRDWTTWRLAVQTGWDGPFIESPSYSVYGPMRYLLAATMILRQTGQTDLAQLPFIPRFLEYFADLTMSDARFGGKRIVPGMGHSANLVEALWGYSMTPLATNPFVSPAWLGFFHRLAQGDQVSQRWEEKNTGYALWYRPDITPQPRELTTKFYPTYGVMFRDRFNQPDETALLLRAGMNWSHWDTDALNVILYAYGAPLSPGTGYQYYYGEAAQNHGIYHNRVKVDRPDLPELFGRVDTCVRDYGFTSVADYARADRFYPGGLFADLKSMEWRRHVLFVKPGYFVMRDTFPGGNHRAKWWNWLNLDGPELITLDEQAATLRTTHGAATRIWFTEPRSLRTRLTFAYPRADGLGGDETKTIVEAAANAGEDFFYVVYPHKNGESVPPFARLGDVGIRITGRESTDYVFVNDEPVAFEQDGVVFAGRAGAVRVYADRVALTLNSGSGKVGYRGHVFEGHGPFERVVPLKDLKPGTHAVTDTYEKKLIAVDVGDGLAVEGEGPFTAKLDGQTIRIRTTGRARVLYVTRPAWMLRPEYRVDGELSMACWTDYPGSDWGRLERTNLVALPVPDGAHELILRNGAFPAVWPRQFTVNGN